jgi:signal transduction histidine kinase
MIRGMRANSLALRLFVSASVWTVAILLVTGLVLSSLNRGAVERAFDRRLDIYLRTLVTEVSSPEQNNEKLQQSLGEPLFEAPASGWYWRITRLDTEKKEVRSSPSLADGDLPHLEDIGVALDSDRTREGYLPGPENQRLRLVERLIDLDSGSRYLIAVAGDSAEIADETRSFDQALIITLSLLAVVLLLTTMFQVRFGLAPLRRITDGLTAIRAGTAERLVGQFPQEIAPLVRETNALIDANKQIVERARTHVGNLAHALKTPLSVIVNEASTHRGDGFAGKVLEQTEIMRDQVTRHLERARLAARLTVVGSITEAMPVLQALGRTMGKIHRDRGITVDVRGERSARFHGERQDLEEMVGNLVDNACKWAASRVNIQLTHERSKAAGQHEVVHIIVDDDGPGLSPDQRKQIVERGRRLDETKPGSGLGLSIVVELANLYGGQLAFDTASIGGLRAALVLPAV